MKQALRSAIVFFVLFTLLLGIVYPSIVTGLAMTLFPKQSEGSLIIGKDGAIKGSSLIGQNFTSEKYFWGRLSATTPPYNAAASSGSNWGVNAKGLLDAVKGRITALRQADAENDKAIPTDLATSSSSGLDPHISPASAVYQIARVAKARGLAEGEVHKLVVQNTEKRQWFILGEPRVNVLKLNLALDEYSKRP
jgi:K+-transporting ATPase ATPase C chain